MHTHQSILTNRGQEISTASNKSIISTGVTALSHDGEVSTREHYGTMVIVQLASCKNNMYNIMSGASTMCVC